MNENPSHRHPPETPKTIAAIDLLGRGGVAAVVVGHEHIESEEIELWYAVGRWGKGGNVIHEMAAGRDAEQAVLRLCEVTIDGGTCTRCGKLTGFVDDTGEGLLSGFVAMTCLVSWDPAAAKFKRACGPWSG